MRKRLTEDAQSREENLPADLRAAVKFIHHSFSEAHWKVSQVTERFCYATLHNSVVEDLNEWATPLTQLKVIVGHAATQRFISQLTAQRLSSTVKAFFDFYLDGVETDLVRRHADLFAIALANEDRLGTSCFDWTEFQAKQLVRSQSHRIPIWVRNVCDKQPYDRGEDLEEKIYWRKWQAPNFLTMKPFMGQDYLPSTVWKRFSSEESLDLLDALVDRYVIHFDCWIRDRKGELLVEAAKRPKQTPAHALPHAVLKDISAATTAKATSPSGRGPTGPKRKATQDVHAKWRSAYAKSKKRRPDMSDVWHAERIAESADGEGASRETIRKNMK